MEKRTNPEQGVLRYKTIGELEKGGYHKDSAGNYWESEWGKGSCLHHLTAPHVAGTPVVGLLSTQSSWMTTTEPLP